MSLHEVAFLPPEQISTPHFINIAAEVKASGPPHVISCGWV